jgi:hypothetical protein
MTLDLADPVAVLLAAADALGKAGIEVAAYGGLALAAYGTPRETRDADLAAVATAGADAAAALATSGIESIVAFDGVRFGGNRVTRLTLVFGVGTPISTMPPRSWRRLPIGWTAPSSSERSLRCRSSYRTTRSSSAIDESRPVSRGVGLS